MKEFWRKVYKFLWDEPAQPVQISELWRNDSVKKLFESFFVSEMKEANGAIIIWTKTNNDGMYVSYGGLDQARAIGMLVLSIEEIKQEHVRRLD